MHTTPSADTYIAPFLFPLMGLIPSPLTYTKLSPILTSPKILNKTSLYTHRFFPYFMPFARKSQRLTRGYTFKRNAVGAPINFDSNFTNILLSFCAMQNIHKRSQPKQQQTWTLPPSTFLGVWSDPLFWIVKCPRHAGIYLIFKNSSFGDQTSERQGIQSKRNV